MSSTPVSWISALKRLSAIQGFLRAGSGPDGTPWGPGFIRKRDWLKPLQAENRKVSKFLMSQPNCLACGRELSQQTTGDHIIPLAENGPDNATNYFPLCRYCNSSKGEKDLLSWFVEKQIDANKLTAHGICAYARLKYQSLDESQLQSPVPEFALMFLDQIMSLLPPGQAKAVNEIN